jgi:7-cyano-7-deazaguanine synthase
MKTAIVLLSGGMDSATLLYFIKKRKRIRTIHALSFAYGQKHSRELDMARWQARHVGVKEHRIVDISFFGEVIAGGSALTDKAIRVPDLTNLSGKQRRQPPTYVPNRNMVFLSLAAAYAEARGIRDIFYGAQAQDEYGYWDCTVDFVKRINHVLRLNRGLAVTVHAPFALTKKADVLRIGLALGVNYSHTWSCYRGGKRPCRICPTCVERAAAFRAVKVRDELWTKG